MKKEYFSPEIKVEEFSSTSLLADVSYIGGDGWGDLDSKRTLGFEEDEDEE